jgi:hypothetical protein
MYSKDDARTVYTNCVRNTYRVEDAGNRNSDRRAV